MEKTITIEEVTIKYLFIHDGISMYYEHIGGMQKRFTRHEFN